MTTHPGDGLFLDDATAVIGEDCPYRNPECPNCYPKRTPPSREFFVRQAVLNSDISRRRLEGFAWSASMPSYILERVRCEFRRLISQYTPAHDLITREE